MNSNVKILEAPSSLKSIKLREKVVFLAGSIEMGKAENWQQRVITNVKENLKRESLIILNPRRDSSLEQSINNPEFKEQVNWELSGIEIADTVFFYFQKETKSPITLLELGKCSNHEDQDIIVCCPSGFWRKGNVDIVCERSNIDVYNNLEDAITELNKKINYRVRSKKQ